MESARSYGQDGRGFCLQLVVIVGLRGRLGIDNWLPIARAMLSFLDEVDIGVDNGMQETAILLL